MLHKCANPACSSPFRRLEEGKLFQVETEYLLPVGTRRAKRQDRPVRRVDRYWLCDRCSLFLTLSVEKGRGVVPVPLATLPQAGVAGVPITEFQFPGRDTTLATLVDGSRKVEYARRENPTLHGLRG